MEDVGRHNAVDKIAGWMLSEQISAADKILYTTGRLTSEMVIKTFSPFSPTFGRSLMGWLKLTLRLV